MRQNEWIPVGGSLPDDDVLVMLCVPEASEPIWPGCLCDGRWYWADGTLIAMSFRVTHWQPFPELPEVA